MKIDCEIRKRPSFWTIVGVPIFLSMISLAYLLILQFFVSSIILNGWLISLFSLGILLSPLVLLLSEFRIGIEVDGKGYRACRELLILNRKMSERCFEGVSDIYWKKHQSVESTQPQYHIYARISVTPDSTDSVCEELLSGGFWYLLSLKADEVASLRTSFRELRANK